MADKRIQDLTAATSVQTNDLFVLEQSGAAKSLTGQILIRDLATALDGHGGIANITYAAPVSPSLNGTLTITMGDSTAYNVTVTNGRGISGITWSDSGTAGDGMTHTGTIAYNDGTNSTVTLNDGVKGDTGAQTYVWFKWAQNYPTQDSDMQNSVAPYIGIYTGISTTAPTTYTSYTWYQYKGDKGDTGSSLESIALTSTSGLVDTYTIYLTGHVATSTFTVTNAKSIVSITQTSGNHSAGTTDIYTITFNDGDTSQFSVYNGANDSGAVSTVSGIQSDGNGDVPLVLSGNGAPTSATTGQLNQIYFNLSDGSIYYCLGDTGGGTQWVNAGAVTIDSSLSSSSENPVQNKVITAKVGTTALNTTATDLSGAVNEVLAGIPSPQTSGTPANLGTAARGSALTYARSDHVHNLPDGLLPSGGSAGQVLINSGSGAAWGDSSTVETTNGITVVKLHDGTMIQYAKNLTISGTGTLSQIASSGVYFGTVSVTLPESFYNQTFAVSGCSRYSTGFSFASGAVVMDVNKINFYVYDFYARSLTDSNYVITFTAIGRWK